MSLLCQLWSLNEAIQALKDQQQLMQKSQQLMQRQNASVSPVLEDSEDLINDEQDSSQTWDLEDIEENGSNGKSVITLLMHILAEKAQIRRINCL